MDSGVPKIYYWVFIGIPVAIFVFFVLAIGFGIGWLVFR